MALSRTLTLYLAVAAAAALPAASAFCAAPLLLRAGSRTPAARSMTMGPVPIVIPTASSGAKIPRVLHAESPGFAASAHALLDALLDGHLLRAQLPYIVR